MFSWSADFRLSAICIDPARAMETKFLWACAEGDLGVVREILMEETSNVYLNYLKVLIHGYQYCGLTQLT